MRGFESKEQKELEILELLGKYILLFNCTGKDGMEHLLVGCRFLVERQGIGTGGGGHAPKTDGSVGKGGFDILAYFRCRGVKYLHKSISGFATGAADVVALRDFFCTNQARQNECRAWWVRLIVLRKKLEVGLGVVADGTLFRSSLADNDMATVGALPDAIAIT